MTKKELLVAESASRVIWFIHYVIHTDIIGGAPNAFITAFYVSPSHRGMGVGLALLRRAVMDSTNRGAVSIETSTIHSGARSFYVKHEFKQPHGDIGEVFLELDVETRILHEVESLSGI